MDTRTEVLRHLKKDKENWVSGEALSRRLGLTRTAVWKTICKLKDDGYQIESTPRKGYRFLKSSEMLLPEEIAEGLDTEILGKQEIVHLKETDSTNAHAKDLAARGAPEGTLVVAEKQTGGRGRKGRVWFSPPDGGIYASIILRPPMPPSQVPKLTFVTAVAAAETLLHLTTLHVRIKWPNDILVNGRKVAGILTEITTDMDAVDYAVVGLGMNVNTRAFPDDIRNLATSLLIESGERFERAVLLREFLRQEEACYRGLQAFGFEPILKRWKELASIIGQKLQVEMIDATYTGHVEAIDPDGILILKDSDGISHRILSGDVAFL